MPSSRSFVIAFLVGAFALRSLTLLAAEDKVASFEYGKPGTDQWEDLSFQVGADGRKSVGHSRGKDRRGVDSRSIDLTGNGRNSKLRIEFTDGRSLGVSIKGDAIQVDDGSGKPAKTFRWEYEGPIDGRGTFCEQCVDEPDAIAFVARNFMK